MGTGGAPAPYHRGMDPVLAAKVWHYWIAVPLAGGAVLAILSTIAGYLKKVQSVKYPRD